MRKRILLIIRLLIFSCLFTILIITQFSCNKKSPTESELQSQPPPEPTKLYLRDDYNLSVNPYPGYTGLYHIIQRYIYSGSSPIEWVANLNGDIIGTQCVFTIYSWGPTTARVKAEILIRKTGDTEISLATFDFTPSPSLDFYNQSKTILDPTTSSEDKIILRISIIGGYFAVIVYDGYPPGNGDSYIEIPGGGLQ